ncbi:MAG: hypothetical protein B6I19_08550, partial [Bacteroidetes bacterium 4572_114]
MKKTITTLTALLITLIMGNSLVAQNNGLEFEADISDNNQTGGYVHISDPIVSTYPFSICAWIKTGSIETEDRVIFSIGDNGNTKHYFGIDVGEDEGGRVGIRARNGGITTTYGTTHVDDNKWHHVVGVFASATSRTLYVDGVSEATSTDSRLLDADNLDDAGIGRWEDSSPKSYFDGQIDEVSVWGKALIGEDIHALMYKELNGTESDLLAYYNLNETSGTTADNLQGDSDLDGTLMHNDYGTTTGSDPEWVTSAAFFGPKYCLDFDGVDDYVDIGTGPVSVKSVEFWAYPATITEYFIDLNGTAYISSSAGTISATGFALPTIYVDGIASTTVVAGKWQHITVTTATGIDASDLDIGRLEGQEEFDGRIDEVRLWSDVRTVSEIHGNTYKTLVGDEEELVGYYNFDRESGTVLLDFSGEDYNDGTLINMADADWVASTAFNTWLNTDDSGWSTASNWSDETPVSTDNVGVYTYSGTGNVQPTASADVSCNDLYIDGDAILTNTSNTITASGNVINYGTLSIAGNMTIGGYLDNDHVGTFTIKSSSSGTGSVIVTGTASGDVKVERFLTHDRWHYISGQTNMTEDFDELSMGLTGGTNGDQFYRWEEAYNYNSNIGNWVDILNGPNGNNSTMSSEGFDDCKGYAINYITTNETLELSGVPYTSNQSINITKTA